MDSRFLFFLPFQFYLNLCSIPSSYLYEMYTTIAPDPVMSKLCGGIEQEITGIRDNYMAMSNMKTVSDLLHSRADTDKRFR